jgi:hypothetical protein
LGESGQITQDGHHVEAPKERLVAGTRTVNAGPLLTPRRISAQ